MSGAPLLRLRDRVLRPRADGPLLMGVLNASPESFFDGGRRRGPGELLEHGRALAAAGTAIVDVGGQSGVTHRPPVSVGEEIERVLPLVEALAGDGVAVSVDTWRSQVAAAAIDVGAVLVNDPSGLSDEGVADACARSGAGLVLCHTRAEPKRKDFPAYADVQADVVGLLAERMAAARARGVGEEQLVLDPGPDLAKTPAQTVAVLKDLSSLCRFGRPVMLAVSRKDFVGAICGRPPGERLAGTLAAVGAGVDAGASVIRTHDVAAVADYLAVRATLRGEREVPAGLRLDEGLRRQESAA